ncbi:MetQ/NlpA family ABC transporter substrate-binding protein [Shigella flexneri]
MNLTPAKDGIFVEGKDSPYVNLIVTREDNKDAENVKKFVQAYQSDEVYEQRTKSLTAALLKAGNRITAKQYLQRGPAVLSFMQAPDSIGPLDPTLEELLCVLYRSVY